MATGRVALPATAVSFVASGARRARRCTDSLYLPRRASEDVALVGPVQSGSDMKVPRQDRRLATPSTPHARTPRLPPVTVDTCEANWTQRRSGPNLRVNNGRALADESKALHPSGGAHPRMQTYFARRCGRDYWTRVPPYSLGRSRKNPDLRMRSSVTRRLVAHFSLRSLSPLIHSIIESPSSWAMYAPSSATSSWVPDFLVTRRRSLNSDLAVFVLLSLTGPGLTVVSGGVHFGLLIPVLIVVVVTAMTVINERRVLEWLRNHRTSGQPHE